MKYAVNRRHRSILVEWPNLDKSLQDLWHDKADIVDVIQAGHLAVIIYRELIDVEPDRSKMIVSSDELNALYNLYPRRAGKKPGLLALSKKIKSDQDYTDIQQAILNFDKAMKDRDKNYIPYFSTFVNRYLDDFLPGNYNETTDERYEFLNG